MQWIGLCLVMSMFAYQSWGHGDHHDDMDMDMDMHMDMGNKSMGMKMYFHFDVDTYVLFKGWKISSTGGMAGSMVGVYLMAFLYEGLKFLREHLFKKFASDIQVKSTAKAHEACRHKAISVPHALQTFLHALQIILSYFLMLIFMTYNGWLCIATVVGAASGYFAFGWKRALLVDITEHCH